jgi:hypothetical protein
MQPRNLPVAVPPVPPLELVDGDGVLDPQPAASSTLALATVTATMDFLNSDLLDEGSETLPQRPPAPIKPQPARGTNVTPPSGIARRLALLAGARQALADLPVMLMPN